MIKKLREKENLYIIAIYVLVLIVYHLLIREYGGDTYNFYSKQMGGHPTIKRILEIMHESYYGLSSDSTSRIIIEIPLFILTNGMHVVLWSVANIFFHIVMMASLMKITDHKHNKLLLCLLLIYPVYDLCSAGWITVYISYFWPLAIGVFAFVSLKKMYVGEKIGIVEGILYLLSVIYSTNLEVCAALYMCVIVLYFVAMTIEKKWNGRNLIFSVAELLICIGAFIFTFTCPGNYARSGSDIRYWFPDFTSLTLIDKVVLSANALASEMINNNLLWLLFTILLLIIVVSKNRNDIRHIVIASIPVVSVLLRTVLAGYTAVYMPYFNELFNIYAGTARVDATNYNSFAAYFPFVYYMTILTIVAYLLINISENEFWGVANLFLLLAGLSTRLILAFSPSVYASGRRTMLVIDYMLIYLMVRLYSEHCDQICVNGSRIKTVSKIMVYLVTIFIVLSNMVSICYEYYYG